MRMGRPVWSARLEGAVAGPGESPEGAGPRLSQVLARRTVVAVAAIVILSVPVGLICATLVSLRFTMTRAALRAAVVGPSPGPWAFRSAETA